MTETRIPMTRPYFLPRPGEPIDLATAARVVEVYGAAVRTETERIEAAVYALPLRITPDNVKVHCWTPESLVDQWCAECPVCRAGHICVEANVSLSRFSFIDVMIDKANGDLVIRDRSDLLAVSKIRTG